MDFSEVSPCEHAAGRTYKPQQDPAMHKETDTAERGGS